MLLDAEIHESFLQKIGGAMFYLGNEMLQSLLFV